MKFLLQACCNGLQNSVWVVIVIYCATQEISSLQSCVFYFPFLKEVCKMG